MTTAKYRVLICSPNSNFLQPYRAHLDEDFEVQFATTEDICAFLVKDWNPQIALVDGDQFGNITAKLRQMTPNGNLGLLVISQSEGIFKEEFAFRSGADHFINQINDYKSIVWRIISLMRRHSGNTSNLELQNEKPNSSITFENVTIYPQDYLVKSNGRVLKVTPIQFKLLVSFITHTDQLLTREWIKENIWDNAIISPRSIDAQISKLKKVVPEIGKNIINVYGQGYILTLETRTAA